jgi:RNA polymerase sigma-70 factor (ECF subfamily)
MIFEAVEVRPLFLVVGVRAGNFCPCRARLNHSEDAVNNDSELIEQTLQGRPAAFGVLVRKYQDRLFNTLAHVLGNVEDAHDVAQDSFIQAFVKLETFQQSSAFYTWLYRIAMNMAATSRRRKRAVLSVDQTREATGREPIDLGESPGERLERLERQRQVRQAIAGLPEEFRAVVVLREIEGFCYETIAEVLDLPVGTVRSRLHRARAQLRDQLKEVLTVKK